MKRENWTFDFGNWIGASERGLILRRAARGSRTYAPNELPDHVVMFLGLDADNRRCVPKFKTLDALREGARKDICRVVKTRGPDRSLYVRLNCRILAPKVEKDAKGYAAASIARVLSDYRSPYHVYRTYYKYVDCGPSMGFRIDGQWKYCDSLPDSWAECGKISVIMVSSIVEGTDAEVPPIELECYPLKTLKDRLSAAVSEVNSEAIAIWNDTHGCDDCGLDGAINPECKTCHGEGVIR